MFVARKRGELALPNAMYLMVRSNFAKKWGWAKPPIPPPPVPTPMEGKCLKFFSRTTTLQFMRLLCKRPQNC